ncbi:MAG: hypothetical protein ABIG44_17225 [Planctomycetota bacterium]
MRTARFFTVVTMLALCVSVQAQPAATLTLEAVKDGQTVGQGSPINWTIKVGVSSGDNAGLALVCCDLTQDAANPVLFDIPLAVEGSIDTNMQNFSRPAGISNPGEGASTGYVGVQRGSAGSMNLIQIGGGQDTFGQALPPGSGIGEVANPITGIGQGAEPQEVVSGTFTAPSTPGTYTYSLQNALVNVMSEYQAPPTHSPVVAATVDTAGASITFTVGNYAIGDMICDGAVNSYDIDAFICALSAQCDYEALYPSCDRMLADCNGDGSVNSYDIDGFIAAVGGG